MMIGSSGFGMVDIRIVNRDYSPEYHHYRFSPGNELAVASLSALVRPSKC
jgi:hypothetical protein